MPNAFVGYRTAMAIPLYVRSFGQVMGMLGAGMATLAATALTATRKPRS